MKRKKSLISLMLVTVLTLIFSVNVFAAENITPRAMIDYNNHWHNKGESMSGSFQVNGNNKNSVRITAKVENFSPSSIVEVVVHGGSSTNGPVLTSVSSWRGDGLSTSSSSNQEIAFPMTFSGYSTYTVEWQVLFTDSSGRIMCWVYN